MVSREPMNGLTIIKSEPWCSIEFVYGFLQGSDLIGRGRNMSICKNTLTKHTIKPAVDVKRL